ncbi:MAG: hypothetical protein H6Q33_2413 [Deltaproteobacteria bacterium]|nr:hypothetical protein [Deltaproteobacteria bacterium]
MRGEGIDYVHRLVPELKPEGVSFGALVADRAVGGVLGFPAVQYISMSIRNRIETIVDNRRFAVVGREPRTMASVASMRRTRRVTRALPRLGRERQFVDKEEGL